MTQEEVLVLYDHQLEFAQLFPHKRYNCHYRNDISSTLSMKDQGSLSTPLTIWTSTDPSNQGNFSIFSNVKLVLLYVSLDESINIVQLNRFYHRARKLSDSVHVVAHSDSPTEPDTIEKKKTLLGWCVSANKLENNGAPYTDLETPGEGIQEYILNTLEENE